MRELGPISMHFKMFNFFVGMVIISGFHFFRALFIPFLKMTPEKWCCIPVINIDDVIKPHPFVRTIALAFEHFWQLTEENQFALAWHEDSKLEHLHKNKIQNLNKIGPTRHPFSFMHPLWHLLELRSRCYANSNDLGLGSSMHVPTLQLSLNGHPLGTNNPDTVPFLKDPPKNLAILDFENWENFRNTSNSLLLVTFEQ